MIEHSEKSGSGVTITSFGWGAAVGPVLKALRANNQKDIFPDAGLFPNAKEFFENVQKFSQAAIADLGQ